MTNGGSRSTRALALVFLVALVVTGFEPFYLRALRLDREVAKRQYDDLPFRRTPGLQQISEAVRRAVPRGERVAFRTPYPGWWDGYSFTYMRAAYLLAEYRLVPLVDSRDQAHPELLGEVEWMIDLGETPVPEGFVVVSSASGASLLRKAR